MKKLDSLLILFSHKLQYVTDFDIQILDASTVADVAWSNMYMLTIFYIVTDSELMNNLCYSAIIQRSLTTGVLNLYAIFALLSNIACLYSVFILRNIST